MPKEFKESARATEMTSVGSGKPLFSADLQKSATMLNERLKTQNKSILKKLVPNQFDPTYGAKHRVIQALMSAMDSLELLQKEKDTNKYPELIENIEKLKTRIHYTTSAKENEAYNQSSKKESKTLTLVYAVLKHLESVKNVYRKQLKGSPEVNQERSKSSSSSGFFSDKKPSLTEYQDLLLKRLANLEKVLTKTLGNKLTEKALAEIVLLNRAANFVESPTLKNKQILEKELEVYSKQLSVLLHTKPKAGTTRFVVQEILDSKELLSVKDADPSPR